MFVSDLTSNSLLLSLHSRRSFLRWDYSLRRIDLLAGGQLLSGRVGFWPGLPDPKSRHILWVSELPQGSVTHRLQFSVFNPCLFEASLCVPVLKCSQAPRVHFVWCWIPCRSLLPPACPQLLISWMMCHPPERNKWGFPWLPCSPPHPMGIMSFWRCLLCIPQTLFCSPQHHPFIPPLPALALGHYCGLQSLPLGCIFSSFSEWLVWNRELITLIPLTAATCPQMKSKHLSMI